jgi:hypothetical protein
VGIEFGEDTHVRKKKSKTLRRIIPRSTWLIVLILGASVPWLAWRSYRGNQQILIGGATAGTAHGPVVSEASPTGESPPKGLARTVYPYSVIPGGIGSVEELKNALVHDPIAAAHYAVFNLARTRMIRSDRVRGVYVSYRLANHIYWTKKTLKIAKGETLITDGDHTARGRCGNLISDVPVGPVSAEEPPIRVLDTLDPPETPQVVAEFPTFAWDPELPPIAGSLPAAGGGFFVPPSLFSPGGSTSPVLPIPPVVDTPEPTTLLLLSVGLGAILQFRKRKRD